jgi:hypothetical protein
MGVTHREKMDSGYAEGVSPSPAHAHRRTAWGVHGQPLPYAHAYAHARAQAFSLFHVSTFALFTRPTEPEEFQSIPSGP